MIVQQCYFCGDYIQKDRLNNYKNSYILRCNCGYEYEFSTSNEEILTVLLSFHDQERSYFTCLTDHYVDIGKHSYSLGDSDLSHYGIDRVPIPKYFLCLYSKEEILKREIVWRIFE